MSGAQARLAALGSMAVLLVAGGASAQQNNGAGLEMLAFTVGPPSVALVALDAAMIVSLASDGSARRGFAINALIFAGMDGLMALEGLAISSTARSDRAILPLSCAALALAGASVGLAIYALFHPPPPDPPPRTLLAPAPRGGRSLQVAPFWNLSPGGSLSGGGALSLRW